MNKQELTSIEAARRLGVGLQYVYSLLWTRKLAGRKVGQTWRISAEAVKKKLKEREAKKR